MKAFSGDFDDFLVAKHPSKIAWGPGPGFLVQDNSLKSNAPQNN